MLHGQRNYKGEKMLKEFSVENWIIGGTCFLIIFTLGCYLWFQNVMASIEDQYTDTNVGSDQLENTSNMPKIKTNDPIEQESHEKKRSEKKDTVEDISGITQLKQYERQSNISTVIDIGQIQHKKKNRLLLS